MANKEIIFPSFALYTANCTGNERNTLYPNRTIISDNESLALACLKDHCAAKLKDNYRKLENFIECDVLMLDIDNDGDDSHNPTPEQWRTSQQVSDILPDVAFYAVASRNNGKVKHSGEGKKERSARPRYHLYFPLRHPLKDSELIKSIKISVHGLIPEIDDNAVDSVRFFYGHSEPEVKYYSGNMDIGEFFVKHPEFIKKPEGTIKQPEQIKRRSPLPVTGEFDREFIEKNAWTILECIPAYGEETWSKVAYSLKKEGLKFELFDKWSAMARESYKAEYKGKSGYNACLQKWKEKKPSDSTNLGFGYLYKLALENDPTLKDRIIKTGQYRKRGQIATRTPAASPATSEVIDGITVKQAVEQPKPTPEPEQWEPLVKGKSLPAFPLNRLPHWVQEHINGFSATTGVSKDYCASAVLGAVSSVVVGHCDVLFNGTHREPVQLYSCFVGSSGTMKSSVIAHFMKPAVEWLRDNNDRIRKYNYAIEKQIEDIERQISAEQKAGKKKDPAIVTDLVEQLNQKRQERHNNYPLPWDDVTPESLINAMKFSRGTANIATAEGNIINVITGRSYTQRGAVQNIDVFLKGSDGESIHQNRITSGETDIKRADISMLLAIQPGLLERLCKSPDAVGRGLAQRFLIYAPEEENKLIDHSIPVAMDPEHMQRWTEHIMYIAARYMDPDQPAKLMELDADADRIIRQFWNYESELIRERGTADEDSITGWLAKCHGKAIRVSALLALLRDKDAMIITGQDAENAVELFKEYYIPMFIASYERPDFLTQAERMIVSWMLRHHTHTEGKATFKQRDIWLDLRQRTIFTGKPGAEQFLDALEQLQERNYIRPVLSKSSLSGRGRPSKEWLINPEVFKK